MWSRFQFEYSQQTLWFAKVVRQSPQQVTVALYVIRVIHFIYRKSMKLLFRSKKALKLVCDGWIIETLAYWRISVALVFSVGPRSSLDLTSVRNGVMTLSSKSRKSRAVIVLLSRIAAPRLVSTPLLIGISQPVNVREDNAAADCNTATIS